MSPFRTSASGPPAAASGDTCSTTVPYAVPLMRASEMRTMSVTPVSQHLRRQAHVADFGHARVALRAAVLQHQHARRVDVEVWIVDARVVVLDVLEHDRAAAVLAAAAGDAADGFSTAPSGARLPRSTAMPPCVEERLRRTA